MKPTIEILTRISQNSLANKEEVFTKLHCYLLHPDIYFVAYKNLYANRSKTVTNLPLNITCEVVGQEANQNGHDMCFMAV